MNTLDKLYHSITRPRVSSETCVCHKEKGKPILLGPKYAPFRGLIQHIPESPESLCFRVVVVASHAAGSFKAGDILGTGDTEKAAVRVADKLVRNLVRVS